MEVVYGASYGINELEEHFLNLFLKTLQKLIPALKMEDIDLEELAIEHFYWVKMVIR